MPCPSFCFSLFSFSFVKYILSKPVSLCVDIGSGYLSENFSVFTLFSDIISHVHGYVEMQSGFCGKGGELASDEIFHTKKQPMRLFFPHRLLVKGSNEIFFLKVS